ncbi:MAG: hypothetical protein HZA53_13535 [Planctomycetes bacterium]|nr:hypothetical protein [Planctomycetota bacterium]
MLRFALVPTFLAPLFWLASQTSIPPAAPLDPVAGCCNVFLHEPLLVYDVAGSTLAGPTYRHLVVYDDGHAFMAATTDAADPGAAAVAVLSRIEVQALKAALAVQGAWTQCDDSVFASDVPLKTVTVLNGTTNALARSFSYGIPNASQAVIEQRIATLIATKFPGF